MMPLRHEGSGADGQGEGREMCGDHYSQVKELVSPAKFLSILAIVSQGLHKMDRELRLRGSGFKI